MRFQQVDRRSSVRWWCSRLNIESSPQHDRGNSLFRELLNSRIVIAVLRALLERSERVYPRDLDTIYVEWEPESGATIPAQADGRELFQWASTIEDGFYGRMDDLGDPGPAQGGHARLDGLTWFSKAVIADVNGPVTSKRVLLLDEVQRLSREQRSSLIEYLTNARENCGIWVAERLEALNHRELLSEGALQQRDYEKVIQLERGWTGARGKTYAKFVEQIANLRAAKAEGFEERDFYSWIAEEDDTARWGPKYEEACAEIRRRIETTRWGRQAISSVDRSRGSVRRHAVGKGSTMAEDRGRCGEGHRASAGRVALLGLAGGGVRSAGGKD